MKKTLTTVALVTGLGVTAFGQFTTNLFVRPAEVRFRLIGDEPVATPDAKDFVPGWKVEVLRDQKSDNCYVLFMAGTGVAATGPMACP